MSEPKVATIERAMAILGAFSDGTKRLSLAELSKRTGLYRSTTLRIAATLQDGGYIHRDADGFYSLGPTLLRLGMLYQSAFDLANYVRPVLADLVQLTQETAAFYVRQGDKRICLFRHHSPSPIRHYFDEGASHPLGHGADGHVLAAFTGGIGAVYDDIRERGYCVLMGKINPLTGGMAAPVFGPGGSFVGAIGLAGLSIQFEAEKGERILAILLDQARRLSRSLSGR